MIGQMTNINEDFVKVYSTLSRNESRECHEHDWAMINAWKNFHDLEAIYVATIVFMLPETKFVSILDDKYTLELSMKSYKDSFDFFYKSLLESLSQEKGPLSRAVTLLGKANIFISFHNTAVAQWIECRKSVKIKWDNTFKKRWLNNKANTCLLGMFWSLVKSNNPIRQDPLSRKEALQFLIQELGPLPIVRAAIGYLNEESLRKRIERLESRFKKFQFIENIQTEK